MTDERRTYHTQGATEMGVHVLNFSQVSLTAIAREN